MSLIRWDPFRDVPSLRKAMNRPFEESFVPSPGAWRWSTEGDLPVLADMVESDDSIVISADLPGLKPDDVDISITDSTLTIKGEYRAEEEGERGDVHFKERRYGKFRRSFALPVGVDVDATEAEFEDGVLKVRLPKTEETKPKQIEVKVRS
jgi:HSP20 family protein